MSIKRKNFNTILVFALPEFFKMCLQSKIKERDTLSTSFSGHLLNQIGTNSGMIAAIITYYSKIIVSQENRDLF